MTQLFGIGLSKTGNHSLQQALRQLGLKCIKPHSVQELAVADGCAVDTIVSCRYQKLAEHYPDALFILTTRNQQDWLRSMKQHLEKYPEAPNSDYAEARKKLGYPQQYDRAALLQVFKQHNEAVKQYFAGTNRLLVLDVSKPNSMDKLSKFLGIPVPFPHLNRTQG